MTPIETGIAVAKAAQTGWPIISPAWKWYKSRVYPKPPVNSIGFAIGIEILDEKCRGQVEEDFIRTLEELLEKSQSAKPIKLVRIPEPLVKKIKNPMEDGMRVLRKSHCVFLIYGKARIRNFEGKANYVLDLEGLVRHDEIEITRSQLLSMEMRTLLPPRTKISGKNDLTEFELNASNVHLAALYIIASAAFLSNDIDFSLELFELLNAKLATTTNRGNPLSVQHANHGLRASTSLNLGFVHLHKAGLFQRKWRKSRNINDLEKMMLHVKQSGLYKNGYQAAVLSSLYYFVQDRSTKRARKVIVPWRVSAMKDAVWAFDEAFFYAYDGKLKDAVRCYEKAFKRETNSVVLVEIEEFLLWILSEEPQKKQIHFCLGMINYFGKGDMIASAKDFDRFLLATEEGKEFPEQREMAKTYLTQIQGEES